MAKHDSGDVAPGSIIKVFLRNIDNRLKQIEDPGERLAGLLMIRSLLNEALDERQLAINVPADEREELERIVLGLQ